MAKIRTKQLKDGSIHFYTGNKKATETEAKKFIKENHELIDAKSLNDVSLRRYAGAVKGGIKRASMAITDGQGHFLSGSLQTKAAKNLGVDINALMSAKKVDNIHDLFAKTPELKQRFDKLVSDTGINYWHGANKVKDKLNDYSGKIFINGVEYDAKNAYRKIRDKFSEIKRLTGNVDAALQFNYKGLSRLDIKLPTKKAIQNFMDSEGEDELEGIEVYLSTKKK